MNPPYNSSAYNYINAAHRHGRAHDNAAFTAAIKHGASHGHISLADAPSLYKAFRLGWDDVAIPSEKVLHHTIYGSLNKSVYERRIQLLSEYIDLLRRTT